eukprot:scaffold14328_cov98-Amphora_coffeaeformis.AAC.1
MEEVEEVRRSRQEVDAHGESEQTSSAIQHSYVQVWRTTVITGSSSIFVHMGSPIYSHFDNPVQDYSPNKKSRQTK